MKYLIYGFCLFMTLAYISCDSEESFDELRINDEVETRNGAESDFTHRKRCFRFVYPVTYTMPDGSTVTGDNAKEVKAGIRAWYAANPDEDTRPELEYPVNVVLRNGEELTLNNVAELMRLKERCRDDRPDDRPRKCFELVYPVTYIMPDGSLITGADAAEVRANIASWYDANPDAEGRPQLQFPVDVVLRNGEEVTINNAEEMRRLKNRCKHQGQTDRPKRCFKLVYPVTYIMPDGSTITGANAEESRQAIRAWYENNPDVREKPALQYPVDIIYIEDDRILTINNADEWEDAKEDCRD